MAVSRDAAASAGRPSDRSWTRASVSAASDARASLRCSVTTRRNGTTASPSCPESRATSASASRSSTEAVSAFVAIPSRPSSAYARAFCPRAASSLQASASPADRTTGTEGDAGAGCAVTDSTAGAAGRAAPSLDVGGDRPGAALASGDGDEAIDGIGASVDGRVTGDGLGGRGCANGRTNAKTVDATSAAARTRIRVRPTRDWGSERPRASMRPHMRITDAGVVVSRSMVFTGTRTSLTTTPPSATGSPAAGCARRRSQSSAWS